MTQRLTKLEQLVEEAVIAAAKPHPLIDLLIARMGSHPEEFNPLIASDGEFHENGRWGRVVMAVSKAGTTEDKARFIEAYNKFVMDDAHHVMMEAIVSGEEPVKDWDYVAFLQEEQRKVQAAAGAQQGNLAAQQVVSLSQQQVQMAAALGISPAQYAQTQAQLQSPYYGGTYGGGGQQLPSLGGTPPAGGLLGALKKWSK